MTKEPTAIVHSRDQLVAAIRAAARPSFAEAKAAPAHIVLLGKTEYHFNEGIHETRANQIVRQILKTSKSAFKVTA